MGTGWFETQQEWAFQGRHLAVARLHSVSLVLLILWCTFWSGVRDRTRCAVTHPVFGCIVVSPAVLRFRGTSGDLLPRFEWRWTARASFRPVEGIALSSPTEGLRIRGGLGFSQFRGPNRDGVLPDVGSATGLQIERPGQESDGWRRGSREYSAGIEVIGSSTTASGGRVATTRT